MYEYSKRQKLSAINLKQALAAKSETFETYMGKAFKAVDRFFEDSLQKGRGDDPDVYGAVFYGFRPVQILETKPSEPLGFAFEEMGIRYGVIFNSYDKKDPIEFFKIAFNSRAGHQPLTGEEAEIALNIVEEELTAENRTQFAGTLTNLRQHLPAP